MSRLYGRQWLCGCSVGGVAASVGEQASAGVLIEIRSVGEVEGVPESSSIFGREDTEGRVDLLVTGITAVVVPSQRKLDQCWIDGAVTHENPPQKVLGTQSGCALPADAVRPAV